MNDDLIIRLIFGPFRDITRQVKYALGCAVTQKERYGARLSKSLLGGVCIAMTKGLTPRIRPVCIAPHHVQSLIQMK